MKRLIAAAVLIAFVIGIYITGYIFVDKTCNTAKTLLSDCVVAYKEQENIEQTITELKGFWGRKESLLSVFINHGSIDEIELSIESLLAQSKYKENPMFYEISSNLKILLHQIMEDTAIGMHSII